MNDDDDDEQHCEVYGNILSKSRCITSVKGENSKHKFISATCSLHSDNEIHMFEYCNDTNEFSNIVLFPHKHEVWDITTCPKEKDLFFCVYNDKTEFQGSLYRIEEDESNKDEKFSLTNVSTIEFDDKIENKGDLRTVLFETKNEVYTIGSKTICEYDIYKNKVNQVMYSSRMSISCGKRDPNYGNVVGFGEKTTIGILDKRQKKPSLIIKKAHRFGVTDIDFNSIKFHHFVSGGEDCKLRFWDIKNPSKPLSTVCAHSHWITKVKFNPHKDQLVLSASVDGLVRLWNMSKLTKTQQPESSSNKMFANRLVSNFVKHEDSVYSVAWSSFDSWIYGSVSYSGSLFIHHVPYSEKDLILSGGTDIYEDE